MLNVVMVVPMTTDGDRIFHTLELIRYFIREYFLERSVARVG